MQLSGAGLLFLLHPRGTCTQMQVGFQEGESTLESLGFCDLELVLLLSCHCIGYLFLNVADLQLPFSVSW